jgi:hypothetical protein
MSYKLYLSAAAVLSGLVFWAPLGKAQNPSSGAQQPRPGSPAAEGSGSGAKEAATGSPLLDAQDLVADTTPLTGALNLSLGLPAGRHSFLLPSFGVSSQVQINPYTSNLPNALDRVETGYATGRLALSMASGRSNLALDYLAGGSFSSDPNQGNAGIQSLHFSDVIHWGRWSTMFGDQLSYTAQSPFGFGGLGSLNNLGVGLGSIAGSNSDIRDNFLPGQSILINGSTQISNAAVGEVDYALSHRGSLTFAGSYGLLDFINAGFQNSSSASFQGGYNYLVDRKNSIGVLYRFNEIMFSGLSQRIDDHGVQLSYARRIVARLSFQVGAGPDVVIYKSPLAASSTVANWMASTALRYQYRHFGAGISFNHYLTGGSGLLTGAQTDLSSGYLSQAFNKDWEGSLWAGYSRNQALQQTMPSANGVAPQAWYATAQVKRNFVRYGSLFIAYSASGQSNLATLCTMPACRASLLTSTISVGYNWGLRPIVLE